MPKKSEAELFLGDYLERQRSLLVDFFSRQKKKAVGVSPLAVDLLQRYENFIGGKGLRGGLTYLAYQLFSKNPSRHEKDILSVSLLVEVTHSFALIHDDIIDEDHLRRSNPTIHKQFESFHRQNFRKRDPVHFGISLGIDLGDLGPYLSNLLLLETAFPGDLKLAFLQRFSEIILKAVFGQALDIIYEAVEKVKREDVWRIHTFKTAYYTIVGPLQYGAILSGLSPQDRLFKALESFGVPVGIAFQLRDDELGLFSDEKTLGKPVDSDLREGKNTLLFVEGFRRARGEDLQFLKRVHGHKELTPADLLLAREIIKKTGALAASRRISRKLVKEGKEWIPEITPDKKERRLLAALADYVIERDA